MGPGHAGMRAGAFVLALAVSVFALRSARAADEKHDHEAAKDTEEPVYELNREITPPRLIRQVNPKYSPGSRGIRIQGSVTIALIVSSQGTPKSPHVVKGLDKDVDQAAIEAVEKWLFAPAKKDGKPVAVNVTVEIQFHSM